VHGCGGLGLAAVMIARAMGANVIGVDVRDDALVMAQQLGAAHTLNAQRETNLVTALHDLTGGGAHVSLDTLGSLETCRNSILSLRKRGRHVQVGLMVADYKDAPVPMNQVIAKELELLGSHGMPAHAYAPMLDMIVRGQLNPKLLVSKTISLAESLAEFNQAGKFSSAGVIVIDRF